MDHSALADLTDDDRAHILEVAELIKNPPADPVADLAALVDVISSKVEELCGRMDKIEDFIENGLIGGLNSLVAEQEHAKSISGLKDKYGSLFPENYGGYLKDHLGDNYETALWDLIHDHLEELKQGEGYTDEAGDASIKEIAENIGKRVSELTGAPASAEVEAPKEEPAATEEDPMAEVRSMISKFRNRGGQAA